MASDFRNESGTAPVGYRYRPDIDGLRAVAVLAVVVYHLRRDWLPGGFSGVDVFFVISGFVVAHSIFDYRYDGFTSFSAWFYARRVRRILPVLLSCVVTVTLFTLLFLPPD